MLMFKAIHELAPTYHSQLVRVADLPRRRSLHSARSNRLLVPSIRLFTVGSQAFLLPACLSGIICQIIRLQHPTLSTFRQRLKTYLGTGKQKQRLEKWITLSDMYDQADTLFRRFS